MKRKRNKKIKQIIVLILIVGSLFLLQKLFTKKWTNGDTYAPGVAEDGVHIQDNETSEKQLKIPALMSKGMTK